MKKISQITLNVALAAVRENFRASVRSAYESLSHLFKIHSMPRVNVCTNMGNACHTDRYTPYDSVALVVSTPLQILRLGAACSVAGVKKIYVLLREENAVMLYLAQAVGSTDIYMYDTTDEILDLVGKENIDKVVCPSGVLSYQQEEKLYKSGVDVSVLERDYLTVIIADDSMAEQWIAADILHVLGCEDRHDVCLLSTDAQYIDHVMTAVNSLKNYLPDNWGDMMMNLRTVFCPTDDVLIEKCETMRPMRVILSCREAEKYAQRIRNVGSVFINNGEAQAVNDMIGSVEPAVSVHHVPLCGVSDMDFIRRRHFHTNNNNNPDIWSLMLTMVDNAECMKGESLSLCMRLMSTTSNKKI